MEKGEVRNKAIAELIRGGRLKTNEIQMFDTRHKTISKMGLCLTCQTDKSAQQFILIPKK